MKLYCITTNRFFKSITDAVKTTCFKNLTASNLIRCCKGEITSTGKDLLGNRLQWCYAEDYLKQPQLPCIEADSRNWIISLTDGRVFKNSKEACLLYGIDASRISMQLNGVKPTAGTDCLGRKLIFQRFEDFRKEQLNEG
ncbi:hypothetical protein P5E39_12845 [Clostridium perfringens]|uniref:hypothetical protein n=1 Tax=Clostridium perfringens TaxID=1502 RepID=UPI002976D890|nr:hypothetical protein [Clostridium perfringens]MDK0834993.1 hypothetical protein [Clostridium perfringens]MDM0495313.1 hypothetical protein [Clostridium perfringens]MDM0781029.1 hypothetical protein [Clostridium perfringens]